MAIEIVAVLAAATAVRAHRTHSIRKAVAAWSPYADTRGLHFQPGRVGWAHQQWPRVEGKRDGIEVAIDGAVHPTHRDYSTAFIAVPPAPWTGNLEITREGLVDKLARLLGGQDIVIGDEPFDRAFVVKAADEGVARQILDADTRRELLGLNADRLVYDDGREEGHDPMVVLELDGVIESFETLDRALRLVTTIASRAA